jgi:hypothetical protein
MNSSLPKRRGRPPGSFSFVKVKLQDLVSMMGEQAIVSVSSKWLKEHNISTEQCARVIAQAQDETLAPEQKIAFSVTSFDSDVDSANEWTPEMETTDSSY